MQQTQVYKFGGASIATPQRMAAVLPIIQNKEFPLVMVVSAMGKTTNALEQIVIHACKGARNEALQMLKELEQQHVDYATQVLDANHLSLAKAALVEYFTELQWAVDGADSTRFDYSYDQVVCMGEILSTRILSFYLSQQGFQHQWVDIRDVLRTDDTYRDARVDWDYSQQRVQELLKPIIEQNINILTQGFIGSNDQNASVTLGREGSDYTAALLAAMLGAASVTIWKDVPGLLNADPKEFKGTVKIEAITYHEVIEMAFYGAQVIHPKTIKPLQNNNIPLFVKCFLHPALKGTVIQSEVNSIFYPPLIVLKKDQVLLQVTTRDFSFINEDNLSLLYSVFHRLNIKVNLIQNAAISFVACIDRNEEKVQQLITQLSKDYKVFRNEDVQLLTIRHFTPEILADLTKGRYILLEQKTRQTVQAIMK
jgi:aspartate kinase